MKRYAGLVVWLGWMLGAGYPAQAENISLTVRHEHALKSCQGQLVFKAETVEYSTLHKQHSRIWNYRDIQQIGLLGPARISVLTYEDQRLKLGKDRVFNFEVTAGKADAVLFQFLQTRVSRPLVSALAPDATAPRYRIFARHRLGLGGGTQGRLEISENYIAYQTEAPHDSRTWRYQDIASIGTTGPFQLRLTSIERLDGQTGDERNFVFDLKERLDPKAYDFVWWKVNGPQISSSQRN
jgi:hypothetical protein